MKNLSILLSIVIAFSFLPSPLNTLVSLPLVNQTGSTLESAQIVDDKNQLVLTNPNGSQNNRLSLDNTILVENPDDTYFNKQWELQIIQAPQAWSGSHSDKSIKIAILDSGIDSTQEDLAGKITAEINFTDSPTTQDKFGHGTAMAGIAAAMVNNALGIAGVGYDASLMNIKVLNDTGGGSYTWIIQGIIWAADHGASIINLSLAGGVDSPELKQAIDYAWNKGVLIIAAAGNTGSDAATFPAAYAHCMAVAATDRNDRKYAYSDYGNWVSVSAPGAAYSTLPGNQYGNLAGTSIAASYVSGLAALAFSLARDTNSNGKLNDEVRAAIENNCDRITDSGTGRGRINAYKTLLSLLSQR